MYWWEWSCTGGSGHMEWSNDTCTGGSGQMIHVLVGVVK